MVEGIPVSSGLRTLKEKGRLPRAQGLVEIVAGGN